MSDTQESLNYALKMYGEKMVEHAHTRGKDTYDNMMFWQNQAWMLAEELAREQQG